MSSQKYLSFRIFKFDMSDSGYSQAQSELFADNFALLVFSNSFSTNESPKLPKWNLEFVGTQSEVFNLFVPEFSHFVNQGSAVSSLFNTKAGFEKVIKREIVKAESLTPAILSSMGFECFSFGQEDYELIVNNTDRFSFQPLTVLRERRFGGGLSTQEDIKNWVDAILALKQSRCNPMIWFNRIWKHSAHMFGKSLAA